jgi:EAL domain-containing protein (putative c-di-GMP-specific phosphodiesterase class I)
VDLVRDADNAMHLAKERGRSRHEVFDRSLRDRVTTRLTVANELRVAIERDELRLVYQPKIDLTTQQAVGVEALLRWDHPTLGSVPPATFIPIAEDIGLMLPIGRWVLEAACEQAAAWRCDQLDLVVAVNVSGRQLADVGLVDHVASVLAGTGIDPAGLCLELTESVLMSDTAQATQTLGELHAQGVQLSVDDFGTGYSSLAYLHRFPVDEVKIDRAFVQGLVERPDQRTLVGAMVAMGSALGLGVVAEGVETVEQAALLRRLGCPTGQGFLFSTPQPAGSLDAILHGGSSAAIPRAAPGDARPDARLR